MLMSFMNGKTKIVPEEQRAQLRTLRPEQIDRFLHPVKATTTQPSLDDRARLQYAQRYGKPYQPVETKPRPHNSDDGLNNELLVVLLVLLVPIMIVLFMWYVHLKPE